MSTGIRLIVLMFVGFVSVTDGARLKLNRSSHGGVPQKGSGIFKRAFGTTVPKAWLKDVSQFICMQKWAKGLSKDTDQYCLVDFEQVKVAHSQPNMKSNKYDVKIPVSWRKCQSSAGKGATPDRRGWALKVCELKGTENVRVSKGSRIHLPKGCFRLTNRTLSADERTWMFSSGKVDVFEAALSANDCHVLQHIPSRRGLFAVGEFPSTQESNDYDYDNDIDTTITTTAVAISENKPVRTTGKPSTVNHYHYHYHNHNYGSADASPPTDGFDTERKEVASKEKMYEEFAPDNEDLVLDDNAAVEDEDEDADEDEDENEISQETDEGEVSEHEDDDEDKNGGLAELSRLRGGAKGKVVEPNSRGSEAELLQSPMRSPELARTPIRSPELAQTPMRDPY